MEFLSDLPMHILILLTFVSFSAGFIDSVAGGGGLLMIPSLLLAGIPSHNALGTNKFVAIFGSATASITFALNKKIIWRIALLGVVFSLLGSVCGTKTILLFDKQTVEKIILTILPFTAIITFIPKKKIKSDVSDFTSRELYVYSPIICFCLGFYDGFFGPGTGTFLILAFYSLLGMNMMNASAVAKVVNLASGVGSFITFAIKGNVLYSIGIPLAMANILGSFIGSKIAIKKGQGFIKIIIIAVFVIMFASLLLRQK